MTTKNSDLITNFEAVPPVNNPTTEMYGRVRMAQGTMEMATTDLDASDIVMLAPIPSGASLLSLEIATDDLDSNGTPTLAWDIGIYDKDGNVVDVDAYASAVTAGQAAQALTDYRFEAADIAGVGQKVWEDAGVSEDPHDQYYIAMTASTGAATAAAGTLSFVMKFVVD